MKLYNTSDKCFNFTYTEYGNISLPYAVLKSEIKDRENFIKRKFYGYFYNECKKYNYNGTLNEKTRDALINFMSCFHWILNYTESNDEDFADKVKSSLANKQIIDEYFYKLVKQSYTEFINNTDIPYIPSFNTFFTLDIMEYTEYWVLKSCKIFKEVETSYYSIIDGDYDEIRILPNKKIYLAYNWLKTWRSSMGI